MAARTGLSAVWHDEGKRWEIRELPRPETEPDGVSIRVQATSVCGSDLHLWRGDGVPEGTYRDPFVFGHEMMGTVAELGSKITTDSLRQPLHEGDRVVFAYFFPCMRCYNCIRGEMGACKFRGGRKPLEEWPVCNGGFAQYYYLRAPQFLFKLPDELDDAAAAPVNCALAQVTEAFHIAKPRFGDNVVIQGAGGLGVNATAVAAEMGANKVIVIDGQEPRLEMARRCGATHTISIKDFPTPESRIQRVMELTNGVGADIVLEVVGFPAAVEEGVQMARMRGTYLEVGHISPNSIAHLDVQKLVSNQLRFYAIQHYDPWIIPNALDFLMRTREKYPLTKVISHSYGLEQIEEAFTTAEWLGREAGSIVTRAIVTP